MNTIKAHNITSVVYNQDFSTFKFHKKKYDWAICDPPYGINVAQMAYLTDTKKTVTQKDGTKLIAKKKPMKKSDWDSKPISKEQIELIKSISKHQAFFGYNYFCNKPFKPVKRNMFKAFIKENPNHWIIWDKMNGENDFSDCEMIYVSKPIKSQVIKFLWNGMMQGAYNHPTIQKGNKALNEKRIHPTQKPAAFYLILIEKLLNPGESIIDTHIGSQSIRIAAHLNQNPITGFEINLDYFNQGNNRTSNYFNKLF